MSLITPAWLWLLLPWSAVVVLVLRGYRPRVNVPFLDLWPRDAGAAEKRRAWRWPPLPLVLLVLALLFVILSLCRPALQPKEAKLTKLTMVVDRGITMRSGERLEKTAEVAREIVEPLLAPEAEVRVVGSDGAEGVSGPVNLVRAIVGKGAGVTDQQMQLRGLLARETVANPVVLVSDLEVRDARVTVISPGGALRNVGITRIAADGQEVLFGLRNDSELREAEVVIAAGEERVSFREVLPVRGEEREYVRPAHGWQVRVEVQVQDDLRDDNHAIAEREQIAPVIQNNVASPAIRKFVAAYSAGKLAGKDAPIVRLSSELASAEGAVIVLPGEAVGKVGASVVPEHPILRNVQFPEEARVTSRPLPAGDWAVLLESGGRPVLAVEQKGRRVWVGFESGEWEKTVGFPIFWSNVVEWAAGGQKVAAPVNIFAPRFGAERRLDREEVGRRLRELAVTGRRVEVGRYGWVGAAVLVAGAMGVAAGRRK